jgi:transglutaminase-like putative cysteine protease
MIKLITKTSFGLILFLILVSLNQKLIAQEKQEKMVFGKIDMADLKMTSCPFDSSANAMVLGDIGTSYFDYDDDKGFFLVHERLLRIKIFKKEGYSLANQEIRFYHSNKEEESISSLKARTYNLENGKIQETKVTDESMFIEEEDNHWSNKKISFPAVKEGSIVELKYTIQSPYLFTLRDWNFQWGIPVRWSEYAVSIPDFFRYSRRVSGYVSFVINDVTERPKSLSMMRYNAQSTASVAYIENVLHLAAKNIPAMKEESFTSSINNYRSCVDFDLVSSQFPNEFPHLYNSSWKQIKKLLLEDEDFGVELNRSGVVKEIVAEINAKAKDPSDKMLLAYNYIRNHMKWNDHYSLYPHNLKKSLQDKTGNSADINLLLVLLMRELDLKADPVILSTRDHGLAFETYPSVSRMNNVICLTRIEDKEYLLDATNPWMPMDIVSFQCLNGEGLVVNPETDRWINLLNDEKNNALCYAEMKITNDGVVKGKMEISRSGYFAVDDRNKFVREGNDDYKKHLKESLKDWNVDELDLEAMDNPVEPVKNIYHITSPDILQVNGNMIYFNVMMNLFPNFNFFKPEDRIYPVDFGCPLKYVYVFWLFIISSG